MGYCIEMLDSKFEIKKENFTKALEDLKGLFTQDKMTCYDSSGYHFSWVCTEKVLKSQTLGEALEEIRYEPVYDNDGNIIKVNFTGEKLGDDMIFLKTLAPYVENKSYIDFKGEDGYTWRYLFQNNKELIRLYESGEELNNLEE